MLKLQIILLARADFLHPVTQRRLELQAENSDLRELLRKPIDWPTKAVLLVIHLSHDVFQDEARKFQLSERNEKFLAVAFV